MKLQPLTEKIVYARPHRLSDVASWHMHIPFAFFTISALRPRLFVELGTHKGDSYCAFCQAVAELQLQARCFALDTWEGDEQAGHYGPQVLDELRRYHDDVYGDFSSLMQTTFECGAGSFRDGTIDLLHIDGCHTYEAVKHDFETWFPKMSPRGVVLLHDTAVDDFGVQRFWAEAAAEFPSFAFSHGNGLGVLAVGDAVDAEFRDFLEQLKQPASGLVDFFTLAGERVAAWGREQNLADLVETHAMELAALRSEVRSQSDQLRALEAARAEALARLAERDRVLDEVFSSTSWRLTGPIRRAKALAGQLRRAKT